MVGIVEEAEQGILEEGRMVTEEALSIYFAFVNVGRL